MELHGSPLFPATTRQSNPHSLNLPPSLPLPHLPFPNHLKNKSLKISSPPTIHSVDFYLILDTHPRHVAHHAHALLAEPLHLRDLLPGLNKPGNRQESLYFNIHITTHHIALPLEPLLLTMLIESGADIGLTQGDIEIPLIVIEIGHWYSLFFGSRDFSQVDIFYSLHVLFDVFVDGV